MKTRHIIVLTALLGTLLIAGCGQRGPLYLPNPGQTETKELPPVSPKRKPEQR